MSDRQYESNILAEIYRHSVWQTEPVEEQPRIRLVQWQVYRVAERRHLVGWHDQGAEGRVSSAVVRYDAATRRAETVSGRIYELVGPRGHSRDAEYVFGVWLRRQGLQWEDAVPVPMDDEGMSPDGV